MTDEDIRARFATLLLPGENVLWVGRPAQGFVIRVWDAVLIPISVAWFAFAVFWAWPFTGFAPLGAKIVQAVFVLMGFYIAFGRFLVDARLRSQTYYAITDRRIVVAGGFTGKDSASFDLPEKSSVSVSGQRGDLATVRFGPAWPYLRWLPTYWREPEFFRTSDAKTAADLLRRDVR